MTTTRLPLASVWLACSAWSSPRCSACAAIALHHTIGTVDQEADAFHAGQ